MIHASGWYARILQHEIDHLNGTIYIDRMQSRTFASVENHKRYWKNKAVAETLA
jgi:peptide deformylase